MTDKKLVSIIVPCYNYARYLPEALDSVLAQTYEDWECIIINDGSVDNTEQVALEYCRKDVRFKYFYKENGGHSSARNFGIKHSLGKFILPLDPDDKIIDCFLEKAVEVMGVESNLKIVCFQTRLFGNVDKIIKMPPYDFRSLLIINYMVNTCMFRKEDFEKTSGYDESMLGFEDWNLWIDLLKDGGRVLELPMVGYFYRKKNRSVFQDVLNNRSVIFRDQLKLYNNHKDVYERYFDSPIGLIQETEKMTQVINAYQQSRTYRIGLKIRSLINWFKSK